MRLLIVIPTLVSYNSFLQELTTSLNHDDWAVHCVCNSNVPWTTVGKSAQLSVQLHEITFPRGFNLVAHIHTSYLLNQLVHEIRPDLIHAHFSSAIFTTALARQQHWCTTIGTFQGVSFPLISGKRGLILKWAESFAVKRLDETWVLSHDDAIALQKVAPNSTVNKQITLGFGCRLERFDTARYSDLLRQELLSDLGLNKSHCIFIFVGRYVQFKGYALVIRAFLKLICEQPAARLLLVGASDPLHSSGLTSSEERLVQQTSQIINLGWQTEVEKYLAISQIMLFPSSREGMPVSVMEALAMGVPVITCNSRGCRDVIRDGIDGIIIERCTTEALVLAMNTLMSNEVMRKQFSAEALAGRQRFDRQNYVNEQIKIYERLVSFHSQSIRV